MRGMLEAFSELQIMFVMCAPGICCFSKTTTATCLNLVSISRSPTMTLVKRRSLLYCYSAEFVQLLFVCAEHRTRATLYETGC